MRCSWCLEKSGRRKDTDQEKLHPSGFTVLLNVPGQCLPKMASFTSKLQDSSQMASVFYQRGKFYVKISNFDITIENKLSFCLKAFFSMKWRTLY